MSTTIFHTPNLTKIMTKIPSPPSIHQPVSSLIPQSYRMICKCNNINNVFIAKMLLRYWLRLFSTPLLFIYFSHYNEWKIVASLFLWGERERTRWRYTFPVNMCIRVKKSDAQSCTVPKLSTVDTSVLGGRQKKRKKKAHHTQIYKRSNPNFLTSISIKFVKTFSTRFSRVCVFLRREKNIQPRLFP